MKELEAKHFKIIIAYLGTRYHGWQKQKNAVTVEGEIIKALNKLFKEFDIKGASRTDAGVHSKGQVASISAKTQMTPQRLVYALNAHLPRDIVVQGGCEVAGNFHPRFHAKRKTYVYKIYNAKIPLPQLNETTYFYHKTLNAEKMNEATNYFLGEHDFFAFSSDGGNVKDHIRVIYNLEVKKNDNLIEIVVTGNGFLYNMVRIIVGTLIDVGLGKKQPEDISKIISSKDRSKSGKKAPAVGLSLENIEYE